VNEWFLFYSNSAIFQQSANRHVGISSLQTLSFTEKRICINLLVTHIHLSSIKSSFLWNIILCIFSYDPTLTLTSNLKLWALIRSNQRPKNWYLLCFSVKHAAFWRKSKDWLARNQNNVSKWGRRVYLRTVEKLLSWRKIKITHI
jgi:hypothetical protein